METHTLLSQEIIMSDSQKPETLINSYPDNPSIPRELVNEINSDASIDECLTLARLYLKRAKELCNLRKGLHESS